MCLTYVTQSGCSCYALRSEAPDGCVFARPDPPYLANELRYSHPLKHLPITTRRHSGSLAK